MRSISDIVRSVFWPSEDLTPRVAALEQKVKIIMSTETDLQNAIAGLQTAVTTYQTTITTELTTLEGQITALQAQVAAGGSPPVTQAQLDALVTQLGVVQGAVAALPVAPAAP
jgi:hypothetical protein